HDIRVPGDGQLPFGSESRSLYALHVRADPPAITDELKISHVKNGPVFDSLSVRELGLQLVPRLQAEIRNQALGFRDLERLEGLGLGLRCEADTVHHRRQGVVLGAAGRLSARGTQRVNDSKSREDRGGL